MGLRSGEFEGQSRTLTLLSAWQCVVWHCPVETENASHDVESKGSRLVSVDITLGVKIAINDDQLRLLTMVNGAPDHHTSTPKSITFSHTALGIAFVATSVDLLVTVCGGYSEP